MAKKKEITEKVNTTKIPVELMRYNPKLEQYCLPITAFKDHFGRDPEPGEVFDIKKEEFTEEEMAKLVHLKLTDDYDGVVMDKL